MTKLDNMNASQPTMDLVEATLNGALSCDQLGLILNKNGDKIKALIQEEHIAYGSLELALESMDALIASDDDLHKISDIYLIIERAVEKILKL